MTVIAVLGMMFMTVMLILLVASRRTGPCSPTSRPGDSGSVPWMDGGSDSDSGCESSGSDGGGCDSGGGGGDGGGGGGD